jgi:hypothetical protein
MILRGWHIESFGHLHDVAVGGLGPGLNLVIAPNEWGKTTTHRFLTWSLAGYPPPQHGEVRRYRTREVIGGTLDVQLGAGWGVSSAARGDGATLRLRRRLGDRQAEVLSAALQPLGVAPEQLLDELGGYFTLVHSVGPEDLGRLDLSDPRLRARAVSHITAGASPAVAAALDSTARRRHLLLSVRGGRIRSLADELDIARRRAAELSHLEGRYEELVAQRSTHLGEARSLAREIDELEVRRAGLAGAAEEVTRPAPARTARIAAWASVLAAAGLGLLVAAGAARRVVATAAVLLCGSLVAALVARAATRGASHPMAVPAPGGEPASAAHLDAALAAARLRRDELLATAGALGQQAHDLASSEEGARQRSLVASLEEELRAAAAEWVGLTALERAIDAAVHDAGDRRRSAIDTAAAWFDHVTEHRWSGVELEGGAVSAVHRRGGIGRLPAQRLSRGATEQLDLCLRLAVACGDESGPPLPMLLDDVLANADGARAEAMAEVLAQCATTHQLVLFSAHEHTVELFQRLDVPTSVIRPGRSSAAIGAEVPDPTGATAVQERTA